MRQFSVSTSAALLLALLPAIGCNTGSGPSSASTCQTPWAGTCQLRSVTKVAERELPVSHVLVEALYEPLDAPASVPPARVQTEARPQHEISLRTHFESHPTVSCEQTVDAQCFPGQLLVHLPEYVPTEEAPEPLVRGCSALLSDSQPAAEDVSASNSQESPNASVDAGVLAERLYFGEDSTEIDSSSRPALEAVAAQLLAEPSIECVAVVGQGTFGERAGIGELRASAVRRLLIERGVEASRLHPVALSTSVQAAGRPEEQPTTDRRVQFRVLLRR